MKTQQRPLGFIADVHGNLFALDAVLRELFDNQVERIYVAGDLLLGGTDPLKVWQRLQEVKAQCVIGVSDVALVSVDPASLTASSESEERMVQQFIDTRNALGDLILERVRRLPERIRIPLTNGAEVLVVHGSPTDPRRELTHDMSDDELLAHVGDDPAELIVCGASHVPFQRDLGELTVANVGSVGQSPDACVAHYALLHVHPDRLELVQRWVDLPDSLPKHALSSGQRL